jgi:hypothetical protein
MEVGYRGADQPRRRSIPRYREKCEPLLNQASAPLIGRLSWSCNLLIFSRCKSQRLAELYAGVGVKAGVRALRGHREPKHAVRLVLALFARRDTAALGEQKCPLFGPGQSSPRVSKAAVRSPMLGSASRAESGAR